MVKRKKVNNVAKRQGENLKRRDDDDAPKANSWESPTLDELARRQNAGPVTDVEALLGGWPGDVDDEFEEEIRRIRQTGNVGG